MPGYSWDRRIARAKELAKEHSAVSELLGFYQSLARFQKSVYQSVASASDHDVTVLVPHFPALIAMVKEAGSPSLKEAATALDQASTQERLDLLAAFWQHEMESHQISAEYAFFAHALLQPFAEYLAERTNSTTEASPLLCPFCGSKPQVAVLRPEGDGAKRFLLCSLCATGVASFAACCAPIVRKKIKISCRSSWPRNSITFALMPATPATLTSSRLISQKMATQSPWSMSSPRYL